MRLTTFGLGAQAPEPGDRSTERESLSSRATTPEGCRSCRPSAASLPLAVRWLSAGHGCRPHSAPSSSSGRLPSRWHRLLSGFVHRVVAHRGQRGALATRTPTRPCTPARASRLIGSIAVRSAMLPRRGQPVVRGWAGRRGVDFRWMDVTARGRLRKAEAAPLVRRRLRTFSHEDGRKRKPYDTTPTTHDHTMGRCTQAGISHARAKQPRAARGALTQLSGPQATALHPTPFFFQNVTRSQ